MSHSFIARTLIGITACLSIGITASAAPPSTQDRLQQIAVYVGDLNLQSEADAQAMVHRIDAAAKTACGGQPMVSSVLPRAASQFRACHIDAMQTAISTLNAPLVSAQFERQCRVKRESGKKA